MNLSLYRQIDRSLAKRLARQAKRIRERTARQTTDMLETGRDLLAAKSELTRGQFTVWAAEECGIQPRLAQLYMRAVEWVDGEGKAKPVSLLEPTAVLELSKQSTPEVVRQIVIDQATKGERVQTKIVRQMISKARRQSVPPPAEKEWDTAREVALAKAAVKRKAQKNQGPANVEDDLLLADFYAAWGALPEHRRVEALLEINADMHLATSDRGVPAFALRPIQ